jgi:alpha-ketoglutarate-dependent sulfate ester dioxygenase
VSITQTELDIRRISGNIGAEISGVRLSGDLPGETIAQIRAAILAHKVVFFRAQHLDDADHLAFAERLGLLTQGHPTVARESDFFDLDYSRTVDRANIWHTDVTFVHQPPSFSVLRSLVIPPVGGDTLWANTATAYAALPAELRELADKLWVLHSNDFDYAEFAKRIQGLNPDFAQKYRNGFSSIVFKTIHPAVRVHPETGERSLLLGGFARGFTGFKSSTFEALRNLFQEEIIKPEHTVRWHWQVGDLIIWDNRATQHYAAADYGTEARRVKRITIVGEVPVSVNGEPSRVVQGDCSAYIRQTSAPATAADAIV